MLEALPSEDLIEGNSLKIPCRAHCYPNTSVTIDWVLEGVTLTDGGWDEEDMSYRKELLTREDEGKYRCRVCNVVGCTTSDPIYLNVSCE